MAESCNKAYGRYLKTLRERRGLSLDDVESLSQSFADPTHKAYLSRCENGHQRPALSKLIPLSRIYEVPYEAMVERMELDLELDRIGGPDTEGLSAIEAMTCAKNYMTTGRYWFAYAVARDAAGNAGKDSDPRSSLAIAAMRCATAALALQRTHYALHEYRFASDSECLDQRYGALISERIAVCHRRLGDLDEARACSDRAVAEAERIGDSFAMAHAYASRATLAFHQNELDFAARLYDKAQRLFRETGELQECSRTLLNLAQIFFERQRYRAARRSLAAAEQQAKSLGQLRSQALGKILLGEIELREERLDRARSLLREAIELAKQVDDPVVRFKAEYQLFRLATMQGDVAAARAIRRRLARLCPWIPPGTPELRDFRSIHA